MAKPVNNVTRSAIPTVRFRNTASGSIGSVTRVSYSANTTTITPPIVSAEMTWGDDHANWLPPHDSPSSAGTIARTINTAPPASILRVGPVFLLFGNNRTNRKIIGTPSGMFTRKIQCQDSWSVMKPPRVGPSTEEIPNIAAIISWYFARSDGGNRSPIVTNDNAIIIPPPTPWIARKMMRAFIVGEVAASTEPTRNIAIPPTYSHLRP